MRRFDEFIDYLPYYAMLALLFFGVAWAWSAAQDSATRDAVDDRWRQQEIGRDARRLCEAVCEHSATREGGLLTSEPFVLERF